MAVKKRKLVQDVTYDNLEQANMNSFKYIERTPYQEIHSTLGWRKLLQFESKKSSLLVYNPQVVLLHLKI